MSVTITMVQTVTITLDEDDIDQEFIDDYGDLTEAALAQVQDDTNYYTNRGYVQTEWSAKVKPDTFDTLLW